MTTSFDTPRVLGHHNPFAAFHDTTDDPLASGPSVSGSRNDGSGGFASYSGNAYGSSTTSADPWSSYYIPPVPSTSAGGSSSSANGLAGIIEEEAIPDVYVQAWNAASNPPSSTSFGSTLSNGNTISLAVLQKVLSNCAALSAGETEKIINLVSGSSGSLAGSYTTASGNATSPTSPFRVYGSSTTIGNGNAGNNGRVSRVDFYIALALAASAQQKEPLSLQTVSSRRNNLPIPSLDLSLLQQRSNSTLTRRPSNPRNPSSPTTPYRAHKVSIGSSSGDPWSDPRNVAATPTQRTAQGDGHFNRYTSDPFRTSPTNDHVPSSSKPPMYSPPRAARMTENGYSSFPHYNEEGGDDDDLSAPHREYLGSASTTTARGEGSSDSALLSLPRFHSSIRLNDDLERIVVVQEEELKGNFLNRYTCYRVINERRRIQVYRRYSDWSALNEYLDVKYAGRVKLSLPPKRMGISSRHVHIASDGQFLERRRRGLTRYIAFIANHPIMKHDKAVKAFLNETMEYSTWRKINATSLTIDTTTTDEASLIGKLTSSQESLIPTSFEGIISSLKEALPGLIDSLTRFCALIERINYRNEQNQSDLIRARLALDSFGELYKGLTSGEGNGGSSYHAGRPKEIEEETLLFNRDILKMSDNMGRIAELDEGKTLGRIEGLERDLKFQRDIWRSLNALLCRYESKLKHDTIDKIKKRIESNQSRYSSLDNSNSGQNRKPKEEEEMKRIIKTIEDDQKEVERLLNRRMFFKWSLTCEMRWIWRLSTLMRVGMSDWLVRENRHYRQVSRIWEQLEDALALAE